MAEAERITCTFFTRIIRKVEDEAEQFCGKTIYGKELILDGLNEMEHFGDG